MTRAFLDSNVLVYSLGDDRHAAIAAIAADLLSRHCVVSVQCLNELAFVARRKLRWSWSDVGQASQRISALCDEIVVLDLQLHRHGLNVAEQYRLSVYDGMIVAAALTAGCDTLYSEDMHAGLVVDGRLTIVNPFA